MGAASDTSEASAVRPTRLIACTTAVTEAMARTLTRMSTTVSVDHTIASKKHTSGPGVNVDAAYISSSGAGGGKPAPKMADVRLDHRELIWRKSFAGFRPPQTARAPRAPGDATRRRRQAWSVVMTIATAG